MTEMASTDSVDPSSGAMVAYRGVYRSTPVPPCVLTKEDIVLLFEGLEEKGTEGLEHHLDRIERPPQEDEDEFELLKTRARETYRLTVMIHGAKGEQIAAYSAESLKKQHLPDKITGVTYDSAFITKSAFNFEPNERFRLHLDFTEPPGFDQYNPNAKPTPNQSVIEVTGQNDTWVLGVHEYLNDFLRSRGTKRTWLHSHGIYNLYYWLFAIPASLWVVFRVGELMEAILSQLHGALAGAIYIYLFFVAFLVARGVVYVVRWMFPLVEFAGSRSKGVRSVLGAALGGLILGLVGDVLWAIFS